LRAVTAQSLSDDPIRTLRAARLSISLACRIDEQTRALIRAAAPRLAEVSAERVRDELSHIVGLPGLHRSLLLLDELGLLDQVLPEVQAMRGVAQSLPHHWDVFEHTLRALDLLEVLLARLIGIETQAHEPVAVIAPEFAWADIDRVFGPMRDALHEHLEKMLSDDRPAWLALKWAAVLHDIAKPRTRTVEPDGRTRFFQHEDIGAELAAGRMRALRFSTVEIERAATIVRHHMRPHHLAESSVSRRATYRFFRDTGEAGVDVLLHALADHLATHGPDLNPDRWAGRLELTRALLDEYFHRREETVSPPPLISGHEVMAALNLEPGPQVGDILEAVREAQAAGEVKTREEALALAKRMKDEG